MFGMTTAVRVYADANKEPEAILLGGTDTDRVQEIQNAVGGAFDAVKRGCLDESGLHKPFILVGYVHDEGRLLNMPLNPIASVLFEQNIFGDVLLVNGTNPETEEYDGETYDVPAAFAEYIIKAMYPSIQESVVFSTMLSTAVRIAQLDGTISDAEFQKLKSYMTEQANAVATSLGDLPTELRDILARCVANAIKKTGGDDE